MKKYLYIKLPKQNESEFIFSLAILNVEENKMKTWFKSSIKKNPVMLFFIWQLYKNMFNNVLNFFNDLK